MALGVALLSVALFGAESNPTPPTCPDVRISLIRYVEDYSVWAPPPCRASWLRAIKHIPLGGKAHLSLGAEGRVRWERFAHAVFDRVPTDEDGQILLRAYPHGDLRLSPQWRIFSQLRSATVLARDGEPLPLDRDALDLHQLFVEGHGALFGGHAFFRFGRQEVARDFRLVSIREWPNVRLAFDGLLVSWSRSAFSIDAYGAFSVGSEEGVFDDFREDPQRIVYGLHAVYRPSSLVDAVSAFYVGYRDDDPPFVGVEGTEDRHSVGSHVWASAGPLSAGVEGLIQFGSIDALRILAWLAAVDLRLEHRFDAFSLRWEASFEAGSGDRDPDDDTVGTFNALYPNNRYFGGTAQVGGFANALHLRNSLIAAYAPLRLTLEFEQFWRASTRDAVYGPSRFPTLVSPGATERFVGHQIDAVLQVQLGRYVDLSFRVAHFFRGDLLKEVGVQRDTTYVATQLRVVL